MTLCAAQCWEGVFKSGQKGPRHLVTEIKGSS